MGGRNWYDGRRGLGAEQHPVDLEVEARLRRDAQHEKLRGRVRRLGRQHMRALKGDALDRWLELEAAMNGRWSLVAEAYYNVGVDAGLAQRVVDDVLADAGADGRLGPAAAVRALAKAPVHIAERLDRATEPHGRRPTPEVP